MKIKVKYEVSENYDFETWELSDLGLTKEEWDEMDEDKRNELLMDAKISQPYWAVSSYEIID